MAINKIIYDVSGEEIVDQSGNVTVYGINGSSKRVNKVVFGTQTLIDITDTSATASDVAIGKYIYLANGQKAVGTLSTAAAIEVDENATVTDEVIEFSSGGGTGIPKNVISGSSVTQELTENEFYVFGTMTSLTITLATPADSAIVNEYHFRFTSGSTATTLTLPNSVTMPSGFQVEASKVYEISIIDNYGTVSSW